MAVAHILSIVVFALWVLALGRAILNLLLVPKLSADARPESEPLVSIVVPARNESHVIERTVRAFLAQDYPHLELIVVDDRSTDATADVLAAIADPRLLVVKGEERPAGWIGKPWALEQGSRRARGELILIADADIVYAPAAVRACVAELLSGNAAMLAVFPYFEMHGFGEQVGMPMLPFMFAVLPFWLGNRWQRPVLAVGGGAGNLVRRDALESIGYFSALRDAIIDDIGLAQLLRRNGFGTTGVRAEGLVRVRMYHGAKAIAEGFTKNLFAGVGRSYVLAALLFAGFFVFHLFPYAFALAGDPYAIATVVLISIVRVVLFAAMGYSLANAMFLHPLMIAFWAYIFLRSVWMTGIRKRIAWRGRVYDAGRTRRWNE